MIQAVFKIHRRFDFTKLKPKSNWKWLI